MSLSVRKKSPLYDNFIYFPDQIRRRSEASYKWTTFFDQYGIINRINENREDEKKSDTMTNADWFVVSS